eukprot:TRINITY_DN4236_c0_g1_i1.p1 TRINITY_DN4236_c0_g1~~TRINITY_DN4236_c0_g1_i1.p1  ORF type:complete len:369 (-),score=33.24 TRINITY_DN4236_c0_g1_i1:8-961(-)
MFGERASVTGKRVQCTACGTDIAGEQHLIGGAPHCQTCSAGIFSCGECGKPVEGPHVVSAGKRFHRACMPSDLRCDRCSGVLLGEFVSAAGRSYHSKCLTCGSCGKNLVSSPGDIRALNGGVFCSGCAETAFRPAPAPAATAAPKKTGTGEDRAREEKQLADAIAQGKVACPTCHKIVADTAPAVSIADAVYHAACVTCFICGDDFPDGTYAVRGGRPCHSTCGGGGAAGGSVCAECSKALEGKFLKHGDAKYHAACFVCTTCHGSLAGGFVERPPSHRLCANCASKSQAVSASTTPLPQKASGFTIDPVTGQKKLR